MTSSIDAKVIGLEAVYSKMLNVFGAKGQGALAKANAKAADDFYALVKRIVPESETSNGVHLVDTLTKASVGSQAVSVSIGTPEAPYPLHLETGHRLPNGTHVPGKPYWFPAKRLTKKQAHDRIVRAYRTAIKAGFPPTPSSG